MVKEDKRGKKGGNSQDCDDGKANKLKNEVEMLQKELSLQQERSTLNKDKLKVDDSVMKLQLSNNTNIDMIQPNNSTESFKANPSQLRTPNFNEEAKIKSERHQHSNQMTHDIHDANKIESGNRKSINHNQDVNQSINAQKDEDSEGRSKRGTIKDDEDLKPFNDNQNSPTNRLMTTGVIDFSATNEDLSK